MTVFEALILGLVQGLTEFLPVSSSGHLILIQRLLDLQGDMLFFDILLHAATLAAVLSVFYKDVIALFRHPLKSQLKLLVLACVPTVLLFLLFKQFFVNAFDGRFLAVGFMVTAVALTATEMLSKKRTLLKRPGIASSLIMGAVQGIAVLPGISRSGSTICAGVIYGLDRKEAARFSFLMSMPIIIGSALMEGLDVTAQNIDIPFWPAVAGIAAAFISGLIAIKFMLKILEKRKMYGFSVYLILIAVVTLFVL